MHRLLQDLAEHDPAVASDDDWERDSSRGWVKRELWTSSELAGWPGWEHLRQVWLVRVWRKPSRDGAVEHLEDRVYATNLPAKHRIHGQHILHLVRGHWRIENELHGALARGAGCPRKGSQLREDDPWWVRRGCGLVNTGRAPAPADAQDDFAPA